MSQLSDYIKTQLANGFSKEQITRVLFQQGYSQEIITKAFAQSHQGEQHISSSNQQFRQLYDYVQQTIAGGYPANQLYSYLISQGYDKQLVDSVFVRLHNQEHTPLPSNIKHEHEISSSSITKIGVMFLLLIIVGGGLFLFINSLSEGKERFQIFELELHIQEAVLEAGDTLRMQVSTVNEGDVGLIETQYKFVISDSLDRIVTQWEKAGGTQTRRDFSEQEVLPNDLEPGTYTVAVIAYYGEKSSRASRTFKIVSFVDEQNVSEEHNVTPENISSETTQDTSTGISEDNGDEQIDLLEPSIQTPISSKRDTDDTLLMKATQASTAEEAAGYCSIMENPTMQSHCYTFVAETHMQYSYCSQIQQQSPREDCYITFLLLGDSSVCQYVELTQNIALCNEFEQIDYLKKFYETGDHSYIKKVTGKSEKEYIDENYDPQNPLEPTLDDLSINDLV